MITLTNYYPCCYGDRLTAMFTKRPFTKNFKIDNNVNKLKTLKFYSFPEYKKRKVLNNYAKQFYSCHRQFGYDFGDLYRVISICVDIDFLSSRFNDIHLFDKHNNAIPIIDIDYKRWARDNIFESDIKLPMSVVVDPFKMKKFCQKHSLEFNRKWINSIKDDIKQYIK